MRLFALCLVFAFAALSPAAASPPTPCAALSAQLDAAPSGPVFLASYPTEKSGALNNAAFLYDNAVAAIALVGCGDTPRARHIGDAMLVALDHDRYWHDGRLRNGYAAGAVSAPVRLAGWWDAHENHWVEDRYQVGSDNGNMAWAMLALLGLDRTTNDPRYRAGALRIAHWTLRWRNMRGPGGFAGGAFAHEPAPETLTWKSTEHNADLAAAFRALAETTGDAHWLAPARAAEDFVRAQWRTACRCFAVGTGVDGVTPNTLLALDAQILPLLAIPGAASRFAFAAAAPRLGQDGGFAYSEAREGLWTEGTAQAALLLRLLGQTARADRLHRAVAAMRTPDGGFYASNRPALPTGFMLQTDPSKPREYFHIPHLAALAWAALEERRFNPFTGTRALPR